MKTEKIFLINLPIKTYSDLDNYDEFNPSLGLLHIATWLDLNGYETKIQDFRYNTFNMYKLIQDIKNYGATVVGISTFTENINLAVDICKYLKKLLPNVKTVLGGPHVSLDQYHSVGYCAVDFIVLKEGESTMLELMEAVSSMGKNIKYGQIPGLIYRVDRKFVRNVRRKSIEDLDLLPIIKRELMGIDNYYNLLLISTSRGCPGRCIYCAATALSGNGYRIRSIKNVFLEIVMLKYLLKDRFNIVYIIDDTFTALTSRVIEFTDLIQKYEFHIEWRCESRVDVITEKLVKRMAESGCSAITYGIESGSQEILDKIRKKIDLNAARRVIGITYNAGIKICLSFMLGHYCDTKKTMEETLEFLREMFDKYKVVNSICFNTPFPGTWQYTHREDLGIKLTTDNFDRYVVIEPIVETKEFSLKDQLDVQERASSYVWNDLKF